MTDKLTVIAIDWHPLHRNTLIGFATVRIRELHLEIQGARRSRERWTAVVSLPARPQLGKDGAVIRGNDGKITYAAIMAFTSRAVADAFSARVVAAVLEAFPTAFEPEGGVAMSAALDDWVDTARAEKIESVLSQRGVLKTLKGRNEQYAGPCPNCGGTDRFGVYLRRNLFNCRGCQRGGGDAISLVRFIEDCDFVTAVEILDGRSCFGGGGGFAAAGSRKPRATGSSTLPHSTKFTDRVVGVASQLPNMPVALALQGLERDGRGVRAAFSAAVWTAYENFRPP